MLGSGAWREWDRELPLTDAGVGSREEEAEEATREDGLEASFSARLARRAARAAAWLAQEAVSEEANQRKRRGRSRGKKSRTSATGFDGRSACTLELRGDRKLTLSDMTRTKTTEGDAINSTRVAGRARSNGGCWSTPEISFGRPKIQRDRYMRS
jgi:hypothetical protein